MLTSRRLATSLLQVFPISSAQQLSSSLLLPRSNQLSLSLFNVDDLCQSHLEPLPRALLTALGQPEAYRVRARLFEYQMLPVSLHSPNAL